MMLLSPDADTPTTLRRLTRKAPVCLLPARLETVLRPSMEQRASKKRPLNAAVPIAVQIRSQARQKRTPSDALDEDLSDAEPAAGRGDVDLDDRIRALERELEGGGKGNSGDDDESDDDESDEKDDDDIDDDDDDDGDDDDEGCKEADGASHDSDGGAGDDGTHEIDDIFAAASGPPKATRAAGNRANKKEEAPLVLSSLDDDDRIAPLPRHLLPAPLEAGNLKRRAQEQRRRDAAHEGALDALSGGNGAAVSEAAARAAAAMREGKVLKKKKKKPMTDDDDGDATTQGKSGLQQAVEELVANCRPSEREPFGCRICRFKARCFKASSRE